MRGTDGPTDLSLQASLVEVPAEAQHEDTAVCKSQRGRVQRWREHDYICACIVYSDLQVFEAFGERAIRS